VHAIIAADIGVLDYATRTHPELALHLSVQGSATNPGALEFYRERFAIRRAVLPRVLSLQQIRHLATSTDVPLEVFGFGSLCVMVEGRCLLSSYATGQSPNSHGVCSPASAVRWEEKNGQLESRLNGVLIDRYREDENAGYPTLCKGRFQVGPHTYHALEEPTSLNTLDLLPELHAIGIGAVKIEGRQRSPAYVRQVTRVWRQAIDLMRRDPENYRPQEVWRNTLRGVSEGAQTTLGAYHRPWQ
jgi:putative protease